MFKRFAVIILVVLLAVLATQVLAATQFDETVDGDLSGDYLNPTTMTLNGGNNFLTATMDPSDKDYLALTIPAGHELSAVMLDSYDSTFGQSFVGIQAGSTFTIGPNDPNLSGSDLLGYTLFGTGDIGTDILDDMGSAFDAIGFNGPLGPGVFTFWIQETLTAPAYGLNFLVNLDYDEGQDGDFSDDGLSPSSLTLGQGTNKVEGSVFGGTVSDKDYVTFRVEPGEWLTEVRLTDYSYPRSGNQSFIGVQRGNQLTEDPANADATNLAGAALFGEDQIGTDILDDLNEGANLGLPSDANVQGFNIPLLAGEYTFWIQETSTDGNADYELELIIVKPTDIFLPMAFSQ